MIVVSMLLIAAGGLATYIAIRTEREKCLDKERKMRRRRRERNNGGNVRFTDKDFLKIKMILEGCEAQDLDAKERFKCGYNDLTVFLNLKGRGLPLTQWDKNELQRLVDFLKSINQPEWADAIEALM